MPQFDRVIFFNQLFYFTILFFSFYFFVVGSFISKIALILKIRFKKHLFGISILNVSQKETNTILLSFEQQIFNLINNRYFIILNKFSLLKLKWICIINKLNFKKNDYSQFIIRLVNNL